MNIISRINHVHGCMKIRTHRSNFVLLSSYVRLCLVLIVDSKVKNNLVPDEYFRLGQLLTRSIE